MIFISYLYIYKQRKEYLISINYLYCSFITIMNNVKNIIRFTYSQYFFINKLNNNHLIFRFILTKQLDIVTQTILFCR